VREYIEENPVKAGLVERAVEWVFGSLYHRLHGLSELLDEPTDINGCLTPTPNR
jgi:hypothetical protein